MQATIKAINEAFKVYDRAHFLPSTQKNFAHLDLPLPIGHGQTISQPSTVKRMLEWLEVQPDDKVLDVGSGSGWTTALLSQLTGPFGLVYAVERSKELYEFGKHNCQDLGVANVRFMRANGSGGLAQFAPYNKILVNAEAAEIPMGLIGQLEPFGKMVIPVNGTILEISRMSDSEYETTVHPGYAFVPLAG